MSTAIFHNVAKVLQDCMHNLQSLVNEHDMVIIPPYIQMITLNKFVLLVKPAADRLPTTCKLYTKWKVYAVIVTIEDTIIIMYHYASPTSGEAYRNRRLTTNFELWVEIFCVSTCFHVRIPKPCLSVHPSVRPSVCLSAPREKKSS